MKTSNIKKILAVSAFIAAIGFGIAGIVIYPAGVIHGSVLILIALLLVLTATLIGLNITLDLDKKFFETKHVDSESKEDLAKIKQIIKEQDENMRLEN